MTTYQRIFGAGPRGIILSILLLGISWYLEPAINLPVISSNEQFRLIVFMFLTLISCVIAIWSLLSLPPAKRGKILVTDGVFKYFRHPLYAAFISFFNFGLAVLLNNLIYVLWAILVHFLWHWNIRSEEELMKKIYSKEYTVYSEVTGRFFPVIRK